MRIKEASLMTGVSPDMLRHYEKLGIISPERQPGNGYRNYSMQDINNVVMIKQYSSLGLSLKTLSSLSNHGRPDNALEELERTIEKLEWDLELARSRLASAQDYHHLFTLLGRERISDVGESPLLYYYPRSEVEPYFSTLDVYWYGAVRPIFRIKKEDVAKPSYPNDQGFLSLQKIRAYPLPGEEIPPRRYWRTLVKEESDGVMNREELSPILQQLEEEGYTLQGHIFLYQIMNANRHHPHKVICVECEIGN